MITEAQEKFIIYIRTKQFWQYRLRNINPKTPVHIPMNEIRERFLSDPSRELPSMVQDGLISIDQRETPTGRKMNLYSAIKAGGIDPRMLKSTGKALNNLTQYMRDILKTVSLKQGATSTLYFDTFLNLKESYIDPFFSVDEFSGRVHTPVSSFHREYRPNILIEGQETDSLDVVAMQPVLLGKILDAEIGENEFSGWIYSGEDIYLLILDKANLQTRDEAKKRFFEILFSKPNDQLSKMFGNANWIEWINDFKRKPFEPNPHTIEKNHSNLAWLLQTTEVQLMEKVWQKLADQHIPFLSVHDEVIVKKSDLVRSKMIFESVLSYEFRNYQLNSKHPQGEFNVKTEQI